MPSREKDSTSANNEAQIAAHVQLQSPWIDQVERAASKVRILGTLPYAKVDFWNRVVVTDLPRRNVLGPLTRRVGIPDLFLIFRLLAKAPKFDVVLLAGGERSDLIYAAVAGLCPWIRTPHVIVDAHWQKSSGLAGRLQKLLFKCAARLLREVQPHSREELDLYSASYGLDRAILKDIPWSSSLLGHDITPAADALNQQPYILTGGHSFRDYNLFLRAAGELGLPVKVGLAAQQQSSEIKALVQTHRNIELHSSWSNAEYIRQTAACRVFAMPIVQGLTRSTADQTLLNAMHMGRLVVASSSIGSRIYLRDGVNGFLVHEPTVAAWKATLRKAWDLEAAEAARMTETARFDGQVHFNEHMRMARTLDNVLAVVDRSHQASWIHPVA